MANESKLEPTKDFSQVGTRLKNTRETLHLSQKDIAARLHLNPTIIATIESGEFSNGKTPMVFLRGYIRAYARMLNLSEEEIHQTMTQLEEPAKAANLSTKVQPIELNNSHRSMMRWISYLVAGTLIVLVAIWWSNHSSNNTTDKPALQTTPIAAPPATMTTPVTLNTTEQDIPQKTAAPVLEQAPKASKASNKPIIAADTTPHPLSTAETAASKPDLETDDDQQEEY